MKIPISWRKRLEIEHRNPQLRSEWECDLAGIQARLGDQGRAFVSLGKSYQERLFDVLFLKSGLSLMRFAATRAFRI